MPSAPRGCQVVGESGQGLIDIVYVHGIRGDPQKTWTARGVPPKRASRFSLFRNRQETTTPEAQNDAAGRDVFWPRDLLLNQLNNVRVVTFGYDADVSSFLSKTSDRSIFSIAQDLVTRLEMLRESTDKDQLDFQNHLYSIFNCTYGVIFLGTPHRGSELASVGKIAARIAGLGLAESDHKLLTALELGSTELERIADSFSRMLPKQSKGMNVYSFFEALPLTGLSLAGKVVEDYSAIIGDACEGKATLQRDHMGLSRFSSLDDPDYQLVFGVIRRWVRQALEWDKAVKADGGRHADAVHMQHKSVEQTRSVPLNRDAPEPVTLASGTALSMDLPEASARQFCGRSQELAQIREAFEIERTHGRHLRIVCLFGLGGVGKTQLALRYLQENRRLYKVVFWINSSSERQILDRFRQMAQSLIDWTAQHHGADVNFRRIALDFGLSQVVSPTTGEIAPASNEKIVVNAVHSWLGREGNSGWIMVFDNADDLDGVDLSSYLPNTAAGDVLLTSRRPEIGQMGLGIEVKCLGPSDARGALMNYAQMDLADATLHPDCDKLVEMLGRLPLALAQAGSYIATAKMSTKDYIARYRLQREYLLQQKPPMALWKYGKTVFTTWEMSFQAILQTQPLAAKLLLICSYLQPDDIWFAIFRLGLDPTGSRADTWKSLWTATNSPRGRLRNLLLTVRAKSKANGETSKFETIPWLKALCGENEFEAAVTILFSYSIVSFNATRDGMSMHTLVHEWCRYRASADETGLLRDFLLIAGRVFDKTLNEWVNMEWDTTVRLTRHVPSTVAAVRQLGSLTGRPNLATIDVCHALEAIGDASGLVFTQFVPSEDTLFVYKQLYDACNLALKPGHQLCLVAMGSYSLWLEKLGRYDEAVPLAKARLDLYIKSLGLKHPDTLSAMNDLGKCLKMSGDQFSAEPILRKAVLLRGDSSSAAAPMINLAMVLVDKGEFTEAKGLLEAALGMVNSSGNLVLQLECTGCLAWVASDMGEQRLALSYLEHAVSLAEQQFGPDSPAALEWSGQQYYHLVDSVALSSAEDILAAEQGIKALIERLGTTETRSVNKVKMMLRLGDLYYRTGSFDKGIGIVREALNEVEATENAQSMAQKEDALISLGRIYWDSGHLREAVACYDRCIGLAASSKSDNAQLAELNKAVALRDAGNLTAAEESLMRCAKPGDHSSLDRTNVASLYTLQGRTAEAKEVYETTLAAMKNARMESRAEYLLTLHSQAMLLRSWGRTARL
ncbi:hypothetical protein ACCO45_013233 [Purpureocillium lilacinum]|uniref:Uncharacterized protein n=1 Tax=Purpureocillium lilacinum TaxID=33203 RepID=A0ACC4DAA6_PURLI